MINPNRAVLLVNLGSPDSTNIPDVKKYLDQFLMDARVLDFPTWFRSFLVRGVILNICPKNRRRRTLQSGGMRDRRLWSSPNAFRQPYKLERQCL
jgi:protoheme ferro-lyase